MFRRRRLAVFGGLAVVLGASVYVPTAAAADIPEAVASVTAPAVEVQPAAVPDFPDYGRGAIGAVGFEGVLAASGDQGPFPMASITKVVTALVVLEARPLGAGEQGPEIEFTQADVDAYHEVLAQNGSLQPVRAGMVLTQRQAMETMLVPSANNYAISLARWAYGSVDAYLAAARAWLDEHGLEDTVVVDTSGLSSSNTSTPADLVELGKLAVAHPALAEIVALPSSSAPGVGEYSNTNKLLGIGGVDGIKTGTTTQAGACLLFSTDLAVGSSTVTLVGVILGAPTHPILGEGVLALLESVTPGFREVTLATAGEVYAGYTTEWGETASAVAGETATLLTWSDAPVSAVVTTEPVEEARAGTEVGRVEFAVGSRTVTVPLTLDRTIDAPDLWWRLANPPWAR